MTARPNVYDVGDLVRVEGEFRDLSGALADPSEVVCKYQDPSGNETTVIYPTSIVRVTTGVYYLDISVDEAGTWYYRWNGTGDVTAAGEHEFRVRETQFV